MPSLSFYISEMQQELQQELQQEPLVKALPLDDSRKALDDALKALQQVQQELQQEPVVKALHLGIGRGDDRCRLDVSQLRKIPVEEEMEVGREEGGGREGRRA
jgi:hypothetical protein